MFGQVWPFITVIALLGGCSAPVHTTKIAAGSLAIAGAWSDESAGIRCRLRVATTHVSETGAIVTALEVLNSTDHTVDLRRRGMGFEPQALWSLGSTIYFGSQLGLVQPGKIEAGRSVLLGPVRLPVTPAVRPRAGAQALSASIAVGDVRVSAPPVDVWIAPAEWGPPVDGVRLCVGAESDEVAVGSPIRLMLYVHNIRHDPLTFAVPDWTAPQVRSEDGVVTLTYTSTPGGRTMDHQRGLIQRHVLDVSKIFVRPGTYRIRAELNGVPPGPDRSTLSPLVSNEIILRVEPARR